MQYRQGDIFLEKVEGGDLELSECKQSIEGEEIEGFIVLALGEATGHAHKLPKTSAKLTKAANEDKFILLVTETSFLTHEEHAPIRIPPGRYRVVRQRVYTPERIKYVAD
jgi:hypothetical protein